MSDPTGQARRWQQVWLWASALLMAGCTHTVKAPHELPLRNAIVRDQLVIHSDVVLPAQHRLFEELTAQRAELVQKLDLPTSDEPIHIYLFDSTEQFTGFMQVNYPSLPARRAFFVEGDTTLSVYAHWGERVAEDLRHEVAHGYLHAVVPNIPLWLDEGLAEYFEVPRGTQGLNRPHLNDLLAHLTAGGWRPDMRRLESLTSAGEMTQSDYAESWAWVHWMLETTPERRELLCAYLQSLRGTETAEPFSARLHRQTPQPGHLLAEHIYALAAPRTEVALEAGGPSASLRNTTP